jgi:hypothetical protein
MTITTSDQFINAMGNNSSRIIIDKANLTNWAVGNYYSLWRATGQPGQGAVPTATAAVCSNTLVGSIGFTPQTPPATSYLGILEAVQPNAAVTLEMHDRLGHMGALSGANTTTQGVVLQLDTLGATSNLSARKGDANYSDVQWWLEWYTDTGGTASNATINVTYNDNSSGNLSVVAVGGTVRATRMIALNSLIPSADSGKYIMRINNIILSASTGTAGSFGVTATRYRASVFMPVGNARYTATYADLGLPEIFNSSCLFAVAIAGATTSGVFKATGKIIHG